MAMYPTFVQNMTVSIAWKNAQVQTMSYNGSGLLTHSSVGCNYKVEPLSLEAKYLRLCD